MPSRTFITKKVIIKEKGLFKEEFDVIPLEMIITFE
jgi:hypothetical protein